MDLTFYFKALSLQTFKTALRKPLKQEISKACRFNSYLSVEKNVLTFKYCLENNETIVNDMAHITFAIDETVLPKIRIIQTNCSTN